MIQAQHDPGAQGVGDAGLGGLPLRTKDRRREEKEQKHASGAHSCL